MSSRRYVPAITGAVSLLMAFFFWAYFDGLWRHVPAVLLLAFGWVSVKTAMFASDKEIAELTDSDLRKKASKTTMEKLSDRL